MGQVSRTVRAEIGAVACTERPFVGEGRKARFGCRVSERGAAGESEGSDDSVAAEKGRGCEDGCDCEAVREVGESIAAARAVDTCGLRFSSSDSVVALETGLISPLAKCPKFSLDDTDCVGKGAATELAVVVLDNDKLDGEGSSGVCGRYCGSCMRSAMLRRPEETDRRGVACWRARTAAGSRSSRDWKARMRSRLMRPGEGFFWLILTVSYE